MYSNLKGFSKIHTDNRDRDNTHVTSPFDYVHDHMLKFQLNTKEIQEALMVYT